MPDQNVVEWCWHPYKVLNTNSTLGHAGLSTRSLRETWGAPVPSSISSAFYRTPYPPSSTGGGKLPSSCHRPLHILSPRPSLNQSRPPMPSSSSAASAEKVDSIASRRKRRDSRRRRRRYRRHSVPGGLAGRSRRGWTPSGISPAAAGASRPVDLSAEDDQGRRFRDLRESRGIGLRYQELEDGGNWGLRLRSRGKVSGSSASTEKSKRRLFDDVVEFFMSVQIQTSLLVHRLLGRGCYSGLQ